MSDDPLRDETQYDEWIANRRAAEPPRGSIDRVMAAVSERSLQRNNYVRLAVRVNESRPARWVACVASLFVGSLPFLFVAHVAELLVF